MSITSALLKATRTSADLCAARQGPKAVAKRAVRRRVYRAEGRTTRRLLRGLGL